MEFRREGKNVIRCVISEEEIEKLGYTIEDIVSNGKRTQQFMNKIFDIAEKEYDTKLGSGLQSVRADIMPDHTISLTFSEHPGSGEIMNHLKNIIDGLLGNVPKEILDELDEPEESDIDQIQVDVDDVVKGERKLGVIALFAFEDLDTLMRYAKQVKVEKIPFNQLYKFEGAYFLMVDMTDSSESDARKLSALTDEYAADVFVGAEKRAFIYEHGKEILKEKALEQLREV